MPWPSWEQALTAALISLVVMWLVRRRRQTRAADLAGQALREFALLAVLYAIWQLARKLPLTKVDGAYERARMINSLTEALHLPSEIAAQHLIVSTPPIAALVNTYYAVVHVPATIIFLVWAFVRHREGYAHWRTGLALVTAGCLIIRFVRVAPPRFIEELGFVDLSEQYGFDVYGPVGTGISDQFAAMPSIHVAWAAVVALGVFTLSPSRWRWVVLLHLPVTMFVVAATGHHWWLDGIVAIVILIGGLALDTAVRRRIAARRAVGSAAASGPAAPDQDDADPLDPAADATLTR